MDKTGKEGEGKIKKQSEFVKKLYPKVKNTLVLVAGTDTLPLWVGVYVLLRHQPRRIELLQVLQWL